MKLTTPEHKPPEDAAQRLTLPPVVCYPPDTLKPAPLDDYRALRQHAVQAEQVIVPPRDAKCFAVPAGSFFRITSVEGSQVGDLNLWNLTDTSERFYSGKTRALHGTHVSTGDSLWSSFPAMRKMATVVEDTLDWYGFDEYGGSVHDVIGTRCDPYTHNLLSDGDHYHYCCHSNLTRALAAYLQQDRHAIEPLVHDVLNVFMCTGFMRETGQYFMKASPVRPGDYIEFFACMDLLGGLSACPGGDCSDSHSSDAASCHPLQVDIFTPPADKLTNFTASAVNGYDRTHGPGN